MDGRITRYQPECHARGCGEPPRFKIAAPWSHGPIRELKNYGLACPGHLDALIERARRSRAALAVGDEEAVGEVAAHPLGQAAGPAGG